MTDAYARFAELLAADLEHAFGMGVVIDDVQIADDGSGMSATLTLLLNGRAESIVARAADDVALRRAIVQHAADRWRTHAFEGLAGPVV